MFCRECGKKESQRLPIDKFTGLCQKCTETLAQQAAAGSQNIPAINDDATLSAITFKDFRLWMQSVIQNTVQGEIKAVLEKCTKDIEGVKKELAESKKDVANLTTKVNTLQNELAEITKENKDIKQTGVSNLKYLINSDRNLRKHNVMLFGVSENDDLVFKDNNGDESHRASDDDEKVAALLLHLESDTAELSYFQRMGKPNGNPRPIKVILKSVMEAQKVILNSKKLNGLEMNIYVKPDKTKKEAEEFKRIGKRKAELLLQHPTTDPQHPIVTLTKGVLRVNGTEVDRYNPVQSLF